MKRILIYLMLVVSTAVVAQQIIEAVEEERERAEVADASEDQAAGQEDGVEDDADLPSVDGEVDGVPDELADNADPALLDAAEELEATEVLDDVEAEFEPDEEEILASLLPRNLSVQVFRSMLESFASEQASRMTAMENATRNAGDMIDALTLTYNRTRQAAITSELIEIISGAEAL